MAGIKDTLEDSTALERLAPGTESVPCIAVVSGRGMVRSVHRRRASAGLSRFYTWGLSTCCTRRITPLTPYLTGG